MVLSDEELVEALKNGEIFIDPEPTYKTKQIQPSSIDLFLDDRLRIHKPSGAAKGQAIDPTALERVQEVLERETEEIILRRNQPFVLGKGMFVLGQTREHVRLSNAVAGRVEGKSSLARFGVGVHVTGAQDRPRFR